LTGNPKKENKYLCLETAGWFLYRFPFRGSFIA